MKFERIHEMIGSDILLQGGIIGAEHLLRAAGADASQLCAAGVKQQRGIRRHADISNRQEHGAGGLTVAVNAKALTGCVVLLYYGLELRKLSWIARTVAHAQRRYGAIGIGRLPRKAIEGAKGAQRACRLFPTMQNSLLNR